MLEIVQYRRGQFSGIVNQYLSERRSLVTFSDNAITCIEHRRFRESSNPPTRKFAEQSVMILIGFVVELLNILL
jgi:hypothetical protein